MKMKMRLVHDKHSQVLYIKKMKFQIESPWKEE